MLKIRAGGKHDRQVRLLLADAAIEGLVRVFQKFGVGGVVIVINDKKAYIQRADIVGNRQLPLGIARTPSFTLAITPLRAFRQERRWYEKAVKSQELILRRANA
jgi:hypothetical protein